MPKLFNVGANPAVLRWHEPAVMPGDSHDFTDEEVAAGIAGDWSAINPREGLSDERAFKLARDTSRQDLDEQARMHGIDPAEHQTKQDVAHAIQAALDAAAQTIDDNAPAESGEKE